MTDIKHNLGIIETEIKSTASACGRTSEDIILICVSKKKSAPKIISCIESGGRHFGENYIQEAVEKIDQIGKDQATWHFIGHLQSNKAKFAVKYFDYIHTVDSLKLATEISKQAKKINKTQKILLQVNISRELTKSGTTLKQVLPLARQISELANISIQGLMCMPPFFDDPQLARPYFQQLSVLKKEIEKQKIPNVFMQHLSMGMSNDFKVAIEEGASFIRVGTAIFGRRD